MKNHFYEGLNLTQTELCKVCMPISGGRLKDIIRQKCQVPTCPLISKTKRNEWSPVTIKFEAGETLLAYCYVEYPAVGSTSMIIHTDKIRF